MDSNRIGEFMLDNDLSVDDVDELLQFIRDNGAYMAGGYKVPPVKCSEFLLDPFYLGLAGQVYPVVLGEYQNICEGNYVECVLTGSIGCAKTTLALWVTAYQLYLVSLLENPQQVFELDRASEILFVFQSLNAKKAVQVNFGRFRELIKGSPYFLKHFAFDTGIESELRFPHRVIARPVSGNVAATIGENVIGGIIDELNFMAVVQNSKASDNASGTYDQAVSLYNSISRRRKSRFMKQGKTAGMLCLVSSKRYPGEFTERKIDEAKNDPTIYVYDKRSWDIRPAGSYTGEWFSVFVGDANHKARIMDVGEEVPIHQRHLVDQIPIEYMQEFETDIVNALRDIAGRSTRATNPYFNEVEKVANCFGHTQSILSLEECDFLTSTPLIYPKKMWEPQKPRWVHIDLSISGDATGVACGVVTGFQSMIRGTGQMERMPTMKLDFLLRVVPPRNGEIMFFKVRALLYKLRELGMNIRWVSFDSFQSRDSIQVLRQNGFTTGLQSVDKTMLPYDVTKEALYDGRVALPTHQHAKDELLSLERDVQKGKVDHPPAGSKDLADAISGVVYGLTFRKETYLDHGISLFEIPPTVKRMVVSARENMQEGPSPGFESAVG